VPKTYRFLSAVLTLGFAATAYASTTLPDSCGSDKVKFDIEKTKSDGTLPPVSEGKSRIVFIDTVLWTGVHIGGGGNTTRFGIDGTWVGATSGNSYFTIEIAPGEHHLCSAEQGVFSAKKDTVNMTSFTAEAGKTYFFEYKVNMQAAYKANLKTASLSAVDGDEGKYRLKSLQISTFTKSSD